MKGTVWYESCLLLGFEFSLCFRGLAGSEVLSAQLKCRGVMVSRQLSYAGVKFDVVQTELTDEFISLYDNCSKLVSFPKSYNYYAFYNSFIPYFSGN